MFIKATPPGKSFLHFHTVIGVHSSKVASEKWSDSLLVWRLQPPLPASAL